MAVVACNNSPILPRPMEHDFIAWSRNKPSTQRVSSRITNFPARLVMASAPFAAHTSCKPAGFGFNSIMSKLEQVEDQVKRLSIAEQEALRDWLDNLLEDRLELKDEFKAEIEAGTKDIAEGRYRIHRP